MLVLLARLSPGIPPSVSVSTQGSFGTSIIRQKVDNSPVTQKGEEKQGNRLSEAEQKYTTGEQERLAEEVNIAKEDLRLENGAYFKGAALAVPNIAAVRAGILQELHDSYHAGHVGINTTLLNAKRMYWWPGMARYIREYVQGCEVSQRNKNLQSSQQGN